MLNIYERQIIKAHRWSFPVVTEEHAATVPEQVIKNDAILQY